MSIRLLRRYPGKYPGRIRGETPCDKPVSGYPGYLLRLLVERLERGLGKPPKERLQGVNPDTGYAEVTPYFRPDTTGKPPGYGLGYPATGLVGGSKTFATELDSDCCTQKPEIPMMLKEKITYEPTNP